MAWAENAALRTPTSKTYQDTLNPHQKIWCGGPVLHYEGSLGSGVHDTNINLSAARINNAQADGWRVTANNWHYFIGRPLTGALANLDGVVGFGGRQGAHWLRFRCERVGYLYVPSVSPTLTNHFTAVGGAPTYGRANLSNQASAVTIGPNAETINASAWVEWRNLWTTPGSGEVYARWRLSGLDLKEELVVNAAARAWITTNAPPATPLAETWFGFVIRLDWADIPRRYVGGVLSAVDTDVSDDGGALALRDAADRLLAFMPLDDVIVHQTLDTGRLDLGGQPIYEQVEHRRRLRKRLWRDGDGRHYLMIGLRCDQIGGLPAGDLIFDPTLTLSVSASSDDAKVDDSGYSDTGVYMNWGGLGTAAADGGYGLRVTNVTIPAGSTVTSAMAKLVSNANTWVTSDHRITAVNEDNTAIFSTGSPPGSRAITSSFIAAQSHGEQLIGGTRYNWPSTTPLQDTLGAAVNAVVNRAGWASGNALAIVNNSGQDASRNTGYGRIQIRTFDYGGADAPQVEIIYTEAVAAGQPAAARARQVPGMRRPHGHPGW